MGYPVSPPRHHPKGGSDYNPMELGIPYFQTNPHEHRARLPLKEPVVRKKNMHCILYTTNYTVYSIPYTVYQYSFIILLYLYLVQYSLLY